MKKTILSSIQIPTVAMAALLFVSCDSKEETAGGAAKTEQAAPAPKIKPEEAVAQYKEKHGDDFEFAIDGDQVTLVKSTSTAADVVIPDFVTVIGQQSFMKSQTLKSVSIPNSVTSIELGAFGGCPALESLNIPASVTTISPAVLMDSNAVKEIKVEGKNFSCNNGLLINEQTHTLIYGINGEAGSKVVIPDSVVTIEAAAFYNQTSLAGITIPNSVTSIGKLAFYSCLSLHDLSFPDSLELIDDGAFSYCVGIKSIDIPNSLKKVGNNIFSNCLSLKSIKVSSSCPAFSDLVSQYARFIQKK